MSDIKSVIQLLCQHLNILMKVNLKPENFRHAKFNNNDKDTIQEFWITLEKMCLALGYIIPSSERCNSQTWVKLQMAHRGYSSPEFYTLPTGNACGSRELMLALMWIIAKENALASLTQESVRQSPLCREYSDASKQHFLHSKKDVSVLRNEEKKDLNLEDQINYCLWLANCIRHNLNQIHDLEELRIKNTHKLHEATAGSSGLPHLSVFETKLVKDPDLLNRWMPNLLKLSDLLNIHAKWLKKKSAFWEWMDSVIELKVKDTSSENVLQMSPEHNLTDFINSVQVYGNGTSISQGPDESNAFPRFYISALYAKSSSNLVRKASSSDLLADLGLSDNGIVMHASDWLAHVNAELQEVEKLKHNKQQELNMMLQAMTQKMGLVAISDVSSGDAESEECSK